MVLSPCKSASCDAFLSQIQYLNESAHTSTQNRKRSIKQSDIIDPKVKVLMGKRLIGHDRVADKDILIQLIESFTRLEILSKIERILLKMILCSKDYAPLKHGRFVGNKRLLGALRSFIAQ